MTFDSAISCIRFDEFFWYISVSACIDYEITAGIARVQNISSCTEKVFILLLKFFSVSVSISEDHFKKKNFHRL